jgi:hypothetical protein
METKYLDKTTFLTLMDEFREIAKRVDFYLKKDVMFLLQIQPTESMTKLEIESAVEMFVSIRHHRSYYCLFFLY